MSTDDIYLGESLEGRINAGKSKKGDAPDRIMLALDGKFAYELQQFLESEASQGGSYFRVRMLVLMAEKLRLAVQAAREKL